MILNKNNDDNGNKGNVLCPIFFFVYFTDSRAAVVILMSKHVVYTLANSMCEVTTRLPTLKIGRHLV